MDAWETTDILICGCGPTGAMLSGYLGRMGIENTVLEREDGITTDPRGIALDDDGIRYVQGLGLYEHIFTEIGSCIPRVRFVGGVHQDFAVKPFLTFDTASSEGNTGHVGVLSHKQPVLEKHLRSVIEDSEFCDLRTSCTLTSIEEDENWVYATYTDPKGQEKRIRSKFLVAADGKTGFARKKYLEPKGIALEWAEQTKYDETWVALNWKIHLPTKQTHPHFPLWALGYTPEAVYDLFFPADFRFLCNAQRAAVCGRFGLPADRLWRFEFVVGKDEDGVEMAQWERVREVVVPYITHPGSRYGLEGDVCFPEDCIEVLRSRPFRFSARSCNKWALGRVILSGDAAHVFPPFGGQGIASGFRDAISLAWRLAILCSSNQPLNHSAMFETWYTERKQQLDKSLASTVRNGTMVNTSSSIQGFLRDWVLWSVQLVPRWKHFLERGPRGEGPVQYNYSAGMPFLPELKGGMCFPQTYCAGVSRSDSQVRFTDDVIFTAEKKGLFQVVVLLRDMEELASVVEDMGKLGQKESRFLSYDEATFFVPRLSVSSPVDEGLGKVGQLFRSADSEEFANSILCRGRPAPRGYNEGLMWESYPGRPYIILRPDRFVFAACETISELEGAAHQLEEMFS